MADGQELEKRIKALEDGSADIKTEVNTCKSISELNSKWYMHQGIVTISVLALLLTTVSVVGYYGGKNLIKHNVKTSVEDGVSISISEYETEVNRKLLALDEKIEGVLGKTGEKVEKVLTDIGNLIPPDVLVTEAGDNIVTESGDKIEIGDKLEFENWYDMGTGAYQHQRYKKANHYFLNALKTNTYNNDAEAYTYQYIGMTHEMNDEHLLAIENFEKAASLKQGYAIPIENIAVVYYRLNDYKNSIKYFSESSKIYKSKGNYKKALNNIRNAIAMLGKAEDSNAKTKKLQEYIERENALEEAEKELINEN